MSFAYLPLYTGDYLRDTRHLSMSEHGAYMLALVYCWDSRGPMPLDERRQFAVVRAVSGDEMEGWRRIRDEFFVRMDDGWYNRRMTKEIERSASISAARSGAASVRWQARSAIQRIDAASHDATAMQVQCTSNASGTTPSPSPSLTPTPEKKKTRSPAAPASAPLAPPSSVNGQVWMDWLRLRKAKKAPVTDTALRQIQREADKAGMSLQRALEVCCNRGWTGFRAEWVEQARGKDIDFDKLIREIEKEKNA